jgi:cystathionine beta-lyase family protein involved in aluminum resistance
MPGSYQQLLQHDFGFDPFLLKLATQVESEIVPYVSQIKKTCRVNQLKVLDAFRQLRVGDYHFQGSTGYGYGDLGRDTLDALFAMIFGAESGLVRVQIVSGTHAIKLSYQGVLRPGDELLLLSEPYDTLKPIVGLVGHYPGSLADWGVSCRVLEQVAGWRDYEQLRAAIGPHTRMVSIQRSRGYQQRPTLKINDIKEIIQIVKKINPEIVCFVDNCYGEFVEELEPCQVGADLIAGSLIKNPGGGLAPTGGYIVGKERYISLVSQAVTASGLGRGIGATLSTNRLLFMGIFLAPQIVGEALQGAIFAACFFEHLGFPVSPAYHEERGDIVQAITLGTPAGLLAFCRGIQMVSPVDSHLHPEPAEMPGYAANKVLMAGGTFIQGSSIELSADAPWRSPYTVYLQGGLSAEYTKVGVLAAAQQLLSKGLIKTFC